MLGKMLWKMLAMPALLSTAASEPAAHGELTLEVPLYVGADIDPGVVQDALREVEQIFAPGGIHLSFKLASPAAPAAQSIVTVAVQPRPASFVVHGCSRNRHDHRLGQTSFRAKRITLWSEQVARAVHGDWDRKRAPNVSDKVYARALGRVLAHELGHFFLRLNGHRSDGLMRASFSRGTLTAKRNRAFHLSTKDLDKMRASLENIEYRSRRTVALPAAASR